MADEDLIQRYEDARRRYENRIKSWVVKFHAIIKPLPRVKHTKNITEKSIERLETVIWPKISKRRKKEAHKEYEIQYENREPSVYVPKPPYNPPTETDFLNNNIPDVTQPSSQPLEEQDEVPDEDGYTSTIDSEAELRQWIANVIESVVVSTSPWGVPNEIYGERAKIIQLVESAFNNAKSKFGEDIKFLRYLEENSDTFNELTLKAIHGYESGGQIHYIEQGGEQAMGQILTLLNFGAPVSQWAEEDMRNGDFSNVFWGSGEDFYQ